MRTLCDVCEGAAAIFFCAADEAALCRSCDEKVHMCNKLASRHVRVGLADPIDVPRCDICENAPAFFYCEIDGSSLCLQCDMIVHVGGKRTHRRYLLLRQRVEFPGDKSGLCEDLALQANDQTEARREKDHLSAQINQEKLQNHNKKSRNDDHTGDNSDMDSKMIDLNARPQRIPGQASKKQRQEDMGIQQQGLVNPSLPLLSLNHVSFVCRSVMESAKFYQEILGFVLIKRPSSFNFEGAWLFNYGIGIHLLQCNSSTILRDKPLVINPRDNHISFQCSDMELVKRKLEEMGMKYVTAVVEEGGIMVDQLFFHDPDGYMIEICNCENLPVLPLSACPTRQSYTGHTLSELDAMEAVCDNKMESQMMENLVTDLIDITI